MATVDSNALEALMGFFHEISVRYADTDAQGHVFFANYLTYFDESMTFFLKHHGIDAAELEASGCGFVYADAQCRWRGAGATFGENVRVRCDLGAIGNTSITFRCAVLGSDQRLICEGQIVVVCVCPTTKTKLSVPDPVRQQLTPQDSPSHS